MVMFNWDDEGFRRRFVQRVERSALIIALVSISALPLMGSIGFMKLKGTDAQNNQFGNDCDLYNCYVTGAGHLQLGLKANDQGHFGSTEFMVAYGSCEDFQHEVTPAAAGGAAAVVTHPKSECLAMRWSATLLWFMSVLVLTQLWHGGAIIFSKMGTYGEMLTKPGGRLGGVFAVFVLAWTWMISMILFDSAMESTSKLQWTFMFVVLAVAMLTFNVGYMAYRRIRYGASLEDLVVSSSFGSGEYSYAMAGM